VCVIAFRWFCDVGVTRSRVPNAIITGSRAERLHFNPGQNVGGEARSSGGSFFVIAARLGPSTQSELAFGLIAQNVDRLELSIGLEMPERPAVACRLALHFSTQPVN
jgi:hypothetical protein